MVDAGFTAYGRVDHGKEGGGYLYKIHTTLVTGGGKARHIPHHAAAERDERGGAIMACGQQAIGNQIENLERLLKFTIEQDGGSHMIPRQGGQDGTEV